MTIPRPAEQAETSLTRDFLYAVRYYLGGRRGLLILAGLALIAGLAMNWSWLVAAGVAPILISVLPCVAMCALGLCMNKAGGKSCSTADANPQPPAVAENRASTTQATPLATLQVSDAGDLPASDDTGPHTITDPNSSKQRRRTDA